MADIKVQIQEIDNAISNLQQLQKACNSRKTAVPPTVGGGGTINELEAICNTYKTVNVSLETLISNTISFLQNVKDSFVSSDTKAAKNMNGN